MQELFPEKADIGIAFDGDADRMLAVDENGKLVDGDQIMAICGNFLKENGKTCKGHHCCHRDDESGIQSDGRKNREFMWRKQKSETVMFLKICWKTDIISEESTSLQQKLWLKHLGEHHNTTGSGLEIIKAKSPITSNHIEKNAWLTDY